jgi:hypothetical protein
MCLFGFWSEISMSTPLRMKKVVSIGTNIILEPDIYECWILRIV